MPRRLSPLVLGLAFAACSTSNPEPAPPPAPPQVVAAPLPSPDEIAARELNADEQVRQAIDRLSYGPRSGLYDSVRAIGVDRWIAHQLDPARIPDPAADRFAAQFPALAESPAQLLADYPPAGVQKRRDGGALTAADSAAIRDAAQRSRRLLTDLQAEKVARAAISERQLDEVMVDFWFNHFNVFAGKGPERYYLPQYERKAIRPYVLGNFRTLLGAVAHSPAMLFYLDNWESRANADEPTLVAQNGGGNGGGYRRAPGAGGYPRGGGGMGPAGTGRGRPPVSGTARPPDSTRRQPHGLNENYARELLELHTLGVDGGYSQEDVIDVARAFTGWSIDKPQQVGTFLFRPEWHDAGSKTVLGHYLPAGKGLEDGEHVLDILAYDPHTARHIAKQLVTRFVSDSAPPELVERAAQKFMESGGDIRETLRLIVSSPEFFSVAAYKTKVKSPFRLVVSALRVVDAAPDPTPRTAQLVARLGEPLYLHQAPNGYPLTGESWINTGAILNRINFGLAVAAGHVPGASLEQWTAGAALANEPHDRQVDGAIALILDGEASPDTRRILDRGVNPMLANAPPRDFLPDALGDSLAVLAEVDASMMAPNESTSAPPPARGAGGGGAKKTGVPRGANPLAQPVELHGFAQVVGLALGAPEFQRY